MQKGLEMVDRKVGEPPARDLMFDFVYEEEMSAIFNMYMESLNKININYFNYSMFEYSMDIIQRDKEEKVLIDLLEPWLHMIEEEYLYLNLDSNYDPCSFNEKCNFIKIIVSFIMNELPNMVIKSIIDKNDLTDKISCYKYFQGDFREELLTELKNNFSKYFNFKKYLEDKIASYKREQDKNKFAKNLFTVNEKVKVSTMLINAVEETNIDMLRNLINIYIDKLLEA